ncbi:MAG: hypothetical protein LBJ44_10985 [Propionibacteriaceae bacterium]|nr:hypothetical protein [Propionibacteriaceae bacterium]
MNDQPSRAAEPAVPRRLSPRLIALAAGLLVLVAVILVLVLTRQSGPALTIASPFGYGVDGQPEEPGQPQRASQEVSLKPGQSVLVDLGLSNEMAQVSWTVDPEYDQAVAQVDSIQTTQEGDSPTPDASADTTVLIKAGSSGQTTVSFNFTFRGQVLGVFSVDLTVR